MARIHKLNDVLVNRISAGEVVERPASALKEILENSIDAGSTQIEVILDKGGIKSIVVKDNGVGIHQDDLPLSLERHATSKISNESDLYNVTTLGFRGEGIASISSVSDFTITSILKNSVLGYSLHCNYGDITSLIPAPIKSGTKVTVNDIFHLIPARKKFLKSDTTEFFHCKNMFERLAISSPSIAMQLTHNDKLIYKLSSADVKTRLIELFNDDQINSNININEVNTQFSISGMVFHPSYTKLKKELQYVYVNNRYVRDRVIMNAIKQAFASTLHSKDNQLNYILFITIDPEDIDVNVHPSKTEIRFKESNLIHNFIYHSINKALSKPISQMQNQAIQDIGYNSSNQSSPNLASNNINFDHTSNNKSQYSKPTYESSYDRNPNVNTNHMNSNARDQSINPSSSAVSNWLENLSNIKNNSRQATMELFNNELSYEELVPPLGFAVCQLSAIYVLSKTVDGLIIVDMHAAHERILLEKLKQEYYVENKIISQNLLLPLNINLNLLQLECCASYQNELFKLGFSYDVDEDYISLFATPMLLDNGQVTEAIIAVIADIIKFGSSSVINDHIDDILSTISCHNAVRAKDELSINEMNALLRSIESTSNAGFCNHGRPTWFKLSIDKLDQVFLRGK